MKEPIARVMGDFSDTVMHHCVINRLTSRDMQALSFNSSLRTTQVSQFRVAARRTGANAPSRSALRVRAEEGAQ